MRLEHSSQQAYLHSSLHVCAHAWSHALTMGTRYMHVYGYTVHACIYHGYTVHACIWVHSTCMYPMGSNAHTMGQHRRTILIVCDSLPTTCAHAHAYAGVLDRVIRHLIRFDLVLLVAGARRLLSSVKLSVKSSVKLSVKYSW